MLSEAEIVERYRALGDDLASYGFKLPKESPGCL